MRDGKTSEREQTVSKEYNRANGDIFEKAIVIFHNLQLGFDTSFDAASGDTSCVPCEADISDDASFYARYEELASRALDSTRRVYGDIDTDMSAIQDLALAAATDPLLPRSELWTQCGRRTMSGSGDIDLGNGQTAEAKFVSAGTGTYHQTSVSYLDSHLGLVPYTGRGSYLESAGYYDQLDDIFSRYGLGTFSATGASPVSQKKASEIAHGHPEAAQEIHEIEKDYRYGYLSYVREQLASYPALLTKFYTDMLMKVKVRDASNDSHVADFLIVGNHRTRGVITYDLPALVDEALNEMADYVSGNQLFDEETGSTDDVDTSSFDLGAIRVTMSWKNHVGLNNPALYVFLTI